MWSSVLISYLDIALGSVMEEAVTGGVARVILCLPGNSNSWVILFLLVDSRTFASHF
jgi:hypothetical protein